MFWEYREEIARYKFHLPEVPIRIFRNAEQFVQTSPQFIIMDKKNKPLLKTHYQDKLFDQNLKKSLEAGSNFDKFQGLALESKMSKKK